MIASGVGCTWLHHAPAIVSVAPVLQRLGVTPPPATTIVSLIIFVSHILFLAFLATRSRDHARAHLSRPAVSSPPSRKLT